MTSRLLRRGILNVGLRVALALYFTTFIASSASAQALDFPIGTNFQGALGSFQLQLTATGGTAPYTFSLSPGASPVPGLHVRNRPYPLPTNFPGTVTGGFIGVLQQLGSFPTSLRVTDSVGAFVDKPVTITVNQFTTLSNTSPPRPVVGTPYDFTLVPFGFVGPLTWSATNMPPGLSVNASGHIVGTPTTAGTYTPSVVMTDTGANNIGRSVGLTIIVNPFDIITDGELPEGTLNSPYNQVIQAPSCVACVFSTTSALPAGLSLASNGILSGTPTATTTGATLSITATGSNGTANKIYSLRIQNNTLQPLAITNNPSVMSSVGGLSNVALFAFGGTSPYTWSIESGTLPQGISLAGPGEALGGLLLPGFSYLIGRPMQTGTFNVTVKVTDSQGVTSLRALTWISSKLSVSFTGLPLAGTTLTAGTPYTQRLLALGGQGTYAWSALGTMPGGLSLDPMTGAVSGTPTDNGVFSVSTQVVDANGNLFTTNVNYSIAGPTATALNIQPLAATIALSRGASFSQNLTVQGGTGPYTITALTALPPGFGLLSGDASSANTGALQFAGTAITAGTFDFTLKATDSLGNVGVRTFRMTVSPLTILTSTLQSGAPGVSYSQQLLSAGGSGALTWLLDTGFTMPQGLSLSTGGLISGMPTQPSSYSITFVVTDSLGARSTRSLTLTISTLRITGSDFLPAASSGVPYNYQFTATGTSGSPTWTVGGLPFGLTLASNGTVSGTAFANFPGTNIFQLFVTLIDGGRVVTRRMTLIVTSPDPWLPSGAPLIVLSDLVLGQGTTLQVGPNGGTPPFTMAVAPGSALPPGLQLISGAQVVPTFPPGTTVIAGAPTFAGLYTFDLVATDALGKSVVRTYTLRVSNISILSGIKTPRAGEAYSFQFTTVGGTGPYTYTVAPWVTSSTPGLPPGLELSPSGLLSGTPTSTGFYSFTVTAQDSVGALFSRNIAVTIADFINGGSGGLLVGTGNPPDTPLGVWNEDWFVQLNRQNGAFVNATWSVVGGSLPPGLSLNGDALAGRPTTAGTYVFRLRGNDDVTPSQFAEREFTMRIVPMQVVAPAVQLDLEGRSVLPRAKVGTPYSFTFKVAGGTPPYTFSNNPLFPTGFAPLGLTLSSAGVLSGTPTKSGTVFPQFVVTDSAGHEFLVTGLELTIVPVGVANPFRVDEGFEAEFPVATGVDFGTSVIARLDNSVRNGSGPFHWSLAPGSSLPPGTAIVSGGGVVSDFIVGKPTTPGVYTFTMNVQDAVGQIASTTVRNLPVIDLALTPLRVPPGIVGTPYSTTLTLSGGAPPYGPMQLIEGSSVSPGLTLSPAGVLSGTPTAAGNYLFAVLVNDTLTGSSFIYRLTIDNAAGQAKGVSLSPSIIDVSQAQGAPSTPIPVAINLTTGSTAFTAVVSGIPGATLSATSGTAPTTINLNLNAGALAPGTYHGMVGVSAPGAVNGYEVTPITVTIAPPPAVQAVSVSPNTGSGATQAFTLQYSDTAGAADLSSARVRYATSSGQGAGTCSAWYDATTAKIRLMDDAGAWGAPVSLGSGTLANGQCTLNLASSTATPNGNNLTLVLNITFNASFTGQKNIFMLAQSSAGPGTGWLQKGTWTPNPVIGPPVVDAISVSPNTGSGATQAFTLTYSDSLGAADLSSARVRFATSSAQGAGTCSAWYNASTAKVQLMDDDGAWGAPVSLGSGTLSNGQCTLNLASSTATPNGNNLTLVLNITFNAGFTGLKNIYMLAASNTAPNPSTGWLQQGTWTPNPAGGPAVVDAVSVSPNTGTGLTQAFTLTYSDSLGASDLSSARVRFAATNVGPGTCSAWYDATTATIRLMDDGGAWGSPVSLGSGTLSNSQCTLNLVSSTATPNGNNLTLVLNITFNGSFTGLKNIYMLTASNTAPNPSTGWVQKGTWTPSGGGAAVVDAISVSPNTGSGTAQTFTMQYSDSFGATDLSSARVRFGASNVGPGTCSVWYDASAGTIKLMDDAGVWGTPVSLGSGTLSNSQCTVNLATSSATPNGTNLTLTLAITFNGSFTGLKNVYMFAGSVSGVSSGWLLRGTWTP
jgi:hypothetical protein